MRTNLKFLTYALLALLFATQFTSCSKDSDLLSDYVINEEFDALSRLVINDNFVVAPGETALLDVLRNDQFDNLENVSIIGTSEPQNGTVNINGDNTLTYTAHTTELQPETTSEEGLPDSFEYTVEQTTENGQTVAETGVVNINNKIPTSGANVFYVTTEGNSNNNGKSEQTSWDLAHAFKAAKAGDVVWIKAGSYQTATLSTSSSGSLGNPITFIGYKNVVGDIVSNGRPTYTKAMFDSDGTVMDSSDMPLLWYDRGSDNDPNGVDGIRILHDYIHIENIKLQYYDIAVDITENNRTGMYFKNIICNELGNWNPTNGGWDKPFSLPPPSGNLSGQGFYATNLSNSSFIDCAVYNAGAAAFFPVTCDNLLFDGCEAYSTKTGNASDYLFDFAYVTNSVLRNYYAYREDLDTSKMHLSRAVMVQLWSSNNLIENGTHINTRTQVEVFSTNNTFRNITVQGSGKANEGNIQISGESNNNLFENWTIDNTEGIQFLGASDTRTPGTDPLYAGNNNYFINFKITNVPSGTGNAIFSYHRLGFGDTDPGGTNYVINLTAVNANALVNRNRPGTLHIYDSSFKNVIYFNIFSTSNSAKDYQVNIHFQNCDFYDNGFSTLSGTGITSGNPLPDGDLLPDNVGASED